MLTLSAAAIVEKNKLASDGAWLILLKVEVPGLAEPLRLVRNTDDIDWNGDAWTAFPFELTEVSEGSQGEIPSLTIQVSNITRIVQGYLEEAQGGVGSTATIYVVHSKHLDQTDAELEEEFSVTGTSADANWVYFTLGPAYPMYARRPERRFLKNFCPFPYGQEECAVSNGVLAVYPTCDRSLLNCRQRGNSLRYGGEPSIPTGGIYV